MKLTKKQIGWLSTILIICGFAFLIWGGISYRHYPGMQEARHIMWLATKHAGIQYVLGFVALVGGYIYLQKY
jgi:hypothetical protein